MVKIGGYKEETARLILEVVRYLKDSGYVISRPGRGERNLIAPQVPIYIRNDTGEIIPPFGCLQVTGTVEYGGQNYIKVDKPVDITGVVGGYLFNGIAPIEIGGYGIAYDGLEVRMLTDGSTITCGEYWQPAVDSFEVVPGGSMFSAIGPDDIAEDVMRAFVSSSGSPVRYFVLAEDAVSLPVWAWHGSLNETTGAIEVVTGSDMFQLYYSNDMLSSPTMARAGYSGHYGLDDGGRYVFTFGPCVVGCETAATIDPGSPPDGEVDSAYTHTVSFSGLDVNGVSAADLPPGLSIDSGTGEISGTPTTAGTYTATLTGDSDDVSSCPLTRIIVITIEAAP